MSERSDAERARDDDLRNLTKIVDRFIETAGVEHAQRILTMLRRRSPETRDPKAPDDSMPREEEGASGG